MKPHTLGTTAQRGRATAGALLFITAACQTAAPSADRAPSAGPAPMPAWLGAPAAVARAAELEEAAALLCGRDTDSVIDDEARHAARLTDGQVVGLLRRAATLDEARAALAADAGPLLDEKRATHAGVATGKTPAGQACAALVGARRLIGVVGGRPAGRLAPGAPLELTLRVPAGRAASLFTLRPDGFVTRSALAGGAEHTLTLKPNAGPGRYVAEVVVDAAEGPSDPEVALLWPWVVGTPREAPFPEVLFPDAGHDDVALTRRAETLLQRLRNDQQLETFKLSPALGDVALTRAQAVSARGSVGHRVASARGATDPMEDVKARFGDEPRARFVRLAEVQAQASTLAEAWRALLDSPAHRHALVDSAFTHAGAAVVRGQDAANRPMITVVALVARRPPQRELDDVRAQVVEAANAVRTQRGLDPLEESAHLHRVALRLALAMQDARRVDDTLLGDPVARVALESDASFTRVQPLVARIDDPLLLIQGAPPALLLGLDTTAMGLGVALDPTDGMFYVVILAGE